MASADTSVNSTNAEFGGSGDAEAAAVGVNKKVSVSHWR